MKQAREENYRPNFCFFALAPSPAIIKTAANSTAHSGIANTDRLNVVCVAAATVASSSVIKMYPTIR